VNSDFDESYSYDDLNQLTGFTRGALNSKDWTYDSLGNRTSVATDGNPAETWEANAQNEITDIDGALAPTYDANGNMISDQTGKRFVYDAWNRLVQVQDDLENPLKSYSYDGLNRKVSEDDGITVTKLLYSANWQVIEATVEGDLVERDVWSPIYVDALVLRDRATTTPGTLDERLWAIQDANFNVTAVVSNSGDVVERYGYTDPYGTVEVMEDDWYVKVGGSDVAWIITFQGMRYDDTSGLFYQRNRWYSPSLGRWITFDPLRFLAGDANLARTEFNNIANGLDPSGLEDPRYPFALSQIVPFSNQLFSSSDNWSTTNTGWTGVRAASSVAITKEYFERTAINFLLHGGRLPQDSLAFSLQYSGSVLKSTASYKDSLKAVTIFDLSSGFSSSYDYRLTTCGDSPVTIHSQGVYYYPQYGAFNVLINGGKDDIWLKIGDLNLYATSFGFSTQSGGYLSQRFLIGDPKGQNIAGFISANQSSISAGLGSQVKLDSDGSILGMVGGVTYQNNVTNFSIMAQYQTNTAIGPVIVNGGFHTGSMTNDYLLFSAPYGTPLTNIYNSPSVTFGVQVRY
jgi:RHS repeat-associated protein